MMSFNEQLFFYICLPPIVFASGFNMQRKDFFGNFRNVILFGIIGTFIAFFVFSGLTILYTQVISKGEVYMTNGGTGETTVLNLSVMEILIMCSLLCSTDTIAAISLLDPMKQPKLFSVVFGEGIVNDGVVIILFNTIMKFADTEDAAFTAQTGFNIAQEFISLGINSLGCGVIFGLSCAYLLKVVRSLTKSPVTECTVIFGFAYCSYVFAELIELSGIITLLTTSIMQANYAWYNLSPQGKQSSVVIFEFMGLLAQGFVFSYIGLTFFFYTNFQWSSQLIIAEMVICVIARSCGTFGMIGLLKACGYQKNDPLRSIKWSELTFIAFAGLIRGAIAFGLVVRMPNSVTNRSVIVTTSLTLVVFTTVVFGSSIGVLGKLLFGRGDDDKKVEDDKSASDLTDAVSVNSASNQSDTVREKLLHYNESLTKS
jgi:NhaP-type Na+/H+ or K+/H+ antiporter